MKGLLLIILAIILNAIMTEIHLKLFKIPEDIARLPDIIIDNFPDYSHLAHYNEYFTMLFGLFPFLFVLQPNAYSYFNNLFYYGAWIHSLRAITKIVTFIPNSDEKCKNENIDPFEKYIIGYCNDKIFSGHVSLTLLVLLLTYFYGFINNTQFGIFYVGHILYSLWIIMTRYHYTVDVILGYIITHLLVTTVNPLT